MRVVVDTNVLVSGMLSGASPPAEVLQLVLQGTLTLLVDSRIMAEYDEVTARPRFRFSESERRTLIDVLGHVAEYVITPPLRVALPDADDISFLEVAAAGSADALITGNVRHFTPTRGTHAVRVVTPRAFMNQLRRG